MREGGGWGWKGGWLERGKGGDERGGIGGGWKGRGYIADILVQTFAIMSCCFFSQKKSGLSLSSS